MRKLEVVFEAQPNLGVFKQPASSPVYHRATDTLVVSSSSPHQSLDRRHLNIPLAARRIPYPARNTVQPASPSMRIVLAAISLLFAIALALPDSFADFVEPLLLADPAQDNSTLPDGGFELVKRQGTTCASGYAACATVGAPGLCCRTNQVCSADGANHVACCPLGSACTGTIIPVSPGTASATTTATSSVVTGSTTTTAANPTGTFVQTGSGANVGSTVPNSYYPIAYIPTTYTNAAACSSAYTSCTNDASSCTAALASGRQGVTVSAPNGGATVTAIASLGQSSASSICSSLSLQACSGLTVEACARFGGATAAAGYNYCGARYAVGAGVAVGIAGQLLR
ncbi:hypothetical protein K491DRAFT_715219 [Lophiostoma macrostomum CBS 122681]|uniref:Uncharacterized protein n=1 Tax=Lophiostoma macrostomum CBS 122681 TaxID=1314788 RepID=A0A6A6TBE5_9PLEO|nr:hypothetical protein K491DRAFT_715219 [Lophiostoma macrostomum CBS 122681]